MMPQQMHSDPVLCEMSRPAPEGVVCNAPRLVVAHAVLRMLMMPVMLVIFLIA
jgi:hypothetical protein